MNENCLMDYNNNKFVVHLNWLLSDSWAKLENECEILFYSSYYLSRFFHAAFSLQAILSCIYVSYTENIMKKMGTYVSFFVIMCMIWIYIKMSEIDKLEDYMNDIFYQKEWETNMSFFIFLDEYFFVSGKLYHVEYTLFSHGMLDRLHIYFKGQYMQTQDFFMPD
jgi:hypothetical protein